MWIINDNAATSRIYDEDVVDQPVSFNENGTAQVADDVGETLVAHYDTIRPYEAEDTDS